MVQLIKKKIHLVLQRLYAVVQHIHMVKGFLEQM